MAQLSPARVLPRGQAVRAQDGVLKQQIDMLRRLMCDVQLMGGFDEKAGSGGAQPG